MLRKVIRAFDAGEDANEKSISLLDALRALQDAWTNVADTSIQACFRHCGFVHTDDESDDHADATIPDANDDANDNPGNGSARGARL